MVRWADQERSMPTDRREETPQVRQTEAAPAKRMEVRTVVMAATAAQGAEGNKGGASEGQREAADTEIHSQSPTLTGTPTGANSKRMMTRARSESPRSSLKWDAPAHLPTPPRSLWISTAPCTDPRTAHRTDPRFPTTTLRRCGYDAANCNLKTSLRNRQCLETISKTVI